MRRLARRLFTLCSMLSLLLAAAALALWLLSYRVERTYRFPPVVPPAAEAAAMPGQPGEWRYQWHASIGGGAFQVMRRHTGADTTLPPGLADDGPTKLSAGGYLAGATDLRAPGFRYFDSARNYSAGPGGVRNWTFGFRYVTLPGWLPALALGLPPALWLLHRRRLARRASAGPCAACGYDLRATPGRCPECGAAAASSP